MMPKVLIKSFEAASKQTLEPVSQRIGRRTQKPDYLNGSALRHIDLIL
jgi:hypothetical protein